MLPTYDAVLFRMQNASVAGTVMAVVLFVKARAPASAVFPVAVTPLRVTLGDASEPTCSMKAPPPSEAVLLRSELL